jgi:peptidoglycan/LPS O-acetylase OafA/YrhL
MTGDGSVADRARGSARGEGSPPGGSAGTVSLWDNIPSGSTDPLLRPDPDPVVIDPAPDTEPDPLPLRPSAGLPHQPALDGLRGLAVAAVVLYHGAAADRIDWLQPWTRGGFLGVSAFFTLSGFLICSLLLTEGATSSAVSLGGFWQRRARRLLPASLLLLLAVTALTPVVGTEAQLEHLPGDVWASLLYVANWRFVVEGADYAAQFQGAPSPLKHLWSLSIEEQWYLVVPLAAVGVLGLRRRAHGRFRRRHLAGVLVLVAAAATAWTVWVSSGEWDNRAYMGTGTRLAEMALGAVAACSLHPGLQLGPRTRRGVAVVAPPLLVAILVTWALTPIEAPWLFRGGFSLHAAAVALVILAAVQPGAAVGGLLGLGVLRALGRISYGVYLFHWPIVWWVTPERLGLDPGAAFGVQLSLTLVVSVVSFRLVERPIRHGGALPGRRALLGASGIAAAVALGAAALPDADRSQLLALGGAPELVVPTTTLPARLDSAPEGGPGAMAVTTLPPPPLKVMVVGDSFAESIVVGLQKWGLLTGRMSVMNQTIVGCPFGRGGSNKGINITRKPPPACGSRDERIQAAIAEFDPDVVLLAGGLWDVAARRPPGFESWTHIGEEDYDWYLTGELSHLIDVTAGGGARVLWASSPYWDPVPGSVIFMGRPPYVEADRARVDRFNEILASVVDPRPEADVVDLAGWLRSQPGGELDRSLRPDGVHFSELSTGALAGWLGPQLLAAAGR